MAHTTFKFNGKLATVRQVDPSMPLLYALRDDPGLKGRYWINDMVMAAKARLDCVKQLTRHVSLGGSPQALLAER